MTRFPSTRRGVRGSLLALVAGSVSAAPPTSYALLPHADVEVSDALVAVIEEYRSGQPGAEERASALLRALDPETAGSIFELEVGRVEIEGEEPFDGDLRDFVLGALAAWPAERVGEELVDRLGAEPDYSEAFVALDMLGRFGDETAVVELLSGLPESALWVRHQRFHSAVERALRSCRARGFGESQELSGWVRSAPSHLLPGPARYLAGSAGVAGVQATRLLLDRDPELDLELVAALGSRDPRGDRDVEDARVGLLRRCLWNGSLARRRQAIASLAALHDTSLVPDLLTMLGGDDAGVGACAHDALRQLAGSDVGGTSVERWKHWYDGEQAWRDAELPVLRQVLRDGEPGPAVRALRDAQGHRLLRRELESTLVRHISHREPAVAAAVCKTLATLDCRGAIAPLEAFATASRRGLVVQEARSALARLSQ